VKPVVLVVWRGGEAIWQKAQLERRAVRATFSGGVPKREKEGERSDIEKREGSGDSKSQTPIEKERVAIERIERAPEELRVAHKKGQNWISMR
jgi:hypothetical protein